MAEAIFSALKRWHVGAGVFSAREGIKVALFRRSQSMREDSRPDSRARHKKGANISAPAP